MDNTRAEQHLDLVTLLLKLWKWKWTLLLVSCACAVSALVFSLLQDPQYASFATVFPAKGDNRDAALNGPDFGFDIHSERLIQMLDSEELRDSVIRRFDLASHYEIDMDQEDWMDDLRKKYFKNISFKKTLYSSVVILVKDKDPQLAADMANYIAEEVNEVQHNLIRGTTEEGIRKLEASIAGKMARVKAIEDTLRLLKVGNLSLATGTLEGQVSRHSANKEALQKRLDQLRRQHNVVQLNDQLALYNAELAQARSQFLESSGKVESLEAEGKSAKTDSLLRILRAEREGASRRVQYYEAQVKDLMGVQNEFTILTERLFAENSLLGESESAYNQLQSQFEPDLQTTQLIVRQMDLNWELQQLNELRRKHELAKVTLLDPTPAAYMVSRARPSLKKSSPNTLLNVALAFSFGLFAGVVFLLLAERFRESLRQMGANA